jgi:hypothetical protein
MCYVVYLHPEDIDVIYAQVECKGKTHSRYYHKSELFLACLQRFLREARGSRYLPGQNGS